MLSEDLIRDRYIPYAPVRERLELERHDRLFCGDISTGAARADATSNATGTPPHGKARTITPDRLAYEVRLRGKLAPGNSAVVESWGVVSE